MRTKKVNLPPTYLTFRFEQVDVIARVDRTMKMDRKGKNSPISTFKVEASCPWCGKPFPKIKHTASNINKELHSKDRREIVRSLADIYYAHKRKCRKRR